MIVIKRLAVRGEGGEEKDNLICIYEIACCQFISHLPL
jgi:hypothetical protein